MVEGGTPVRDATKKTLVCRKCDRAIEDCAFCEGEDCAVALCHHCVLVELGETRSQPHDHGG